MPRVGGVYSLPPGYFATDGTTIEVSQHNPPLEDIAQALTDSLPRDGSAPMTGNLNMGAGTFKITNLAAGTNPNDAVRLAQVPISAFLLSASALSMAAGEYIYASGTNIAAKGTISADARAFLAAANYAAMRTALGVPASGAITVANMDPAAIVTAAETIAANNNDTTIPTSAAVKAYADLVASAAVTDAMLDTGAATAAGTTWVGLRMAGITANVVGAIALMWDQTTLPATRNPNDQVAGSSLRYGSVAASTAIVGSGTWQCMGFAQTNIVGTIPLTDSRRATIWMRIA